MKIGILTSGGDCPGLNAVIRGAVRKGDKTYEDEFIGFLDGWRGVIEDEIMPIPRRKVRGLSRLGGTILGSSRSNPFHDDGDGAALVKRTLEAHDIDAIIARIDLIGLADQIIDGVDLPTIIRESTGTVTADVMTDVRSQTARADDMISGFVDRMLGREPGTQERQ